MNITKGIIPTARKVVVYGPEGIGKSTFAGQFPGAVFLDTEGSTVHMDVARFDPPAAWKDVLATVDWATANADKIGTFVIDTMDWAEALAIRAVCAAKHVEGIEDIPYGKGYVFVKDLVRELLERLDRLRDKGVHIVLTAHAIVRKFEMPDELGSFDRYTMKLNEKNIAPLVKEWADMLLFANYKTDVVSTQDGKKKATGGKRRVMYATHAATWDAKNRFGLPDEMPFSYDSIAHLFVTSADDEPGDGPQPVQDAPGAPAAPETKKNPPAKKKPQRATQPPRSMVSGDAGKDADLAELWKRMTAANVPDPLLLQAAVAAREFYPSSVEPKDYDAEFIRDVLLEAWDSVLHLMDSLDGDLPF